MNKKKEIIHLTIDTRYGGIYRFIELWSKLDKDNKLTKKIIHKTFVYNRLEKTIFLINKRLSNTRSNSGYLFIFDFLINLPSYLYYGIKSDIIILHSIYLSPLLPLFSIFNKNIFLISHDYNAPKLLKEICKLLIIKKHLFVAPWLMNSFNNSKKYSFKNICLPINLKINLLDKIILEKDIFKKDKKFNLSFVYIGSLASVKGINDLIINLNNIEINCVVHVIGPKEKRYMENLNKLNQNHTINFHGSIYDNEKKKEIFSKSMFAIIPSRSEVFPFVYSEYLISGLIPICNNLNVFKELSFSRNHIYDSSKPKDFKKCIEWTLSLDNEGYLSYHQELCKNFNDFVKGYQNVASLSERILDGYFK